MKPYLPLLSACLLLAACETNEQDKEAIKAQAKVDAHTLQGKAEQSGMRVANNVRDQVKKTGMMMRKWWLTPLPDQTPAPVPSSYCYRVMQDIVCYRAPMPGQEHQLVGYQGDNAPPPDTLQTKALPVSRIQKQNAAASPASRIANAKPVFVSMPVQPKEDRTQATLDATPQVGSEPLPDPAHSPQL